MNIQNMAQIFIIYVELSPIIRSKFQKKRKSNFPIAKVKKLQCWENVSWRGYYEIILVLYYSILLYYFFTVLINQKVLE